MRYKPVHTGVFFSVSEKLIYFICVFFDLTSHLNYSVREIGTSVQVVRTLRRFFVVDFFSPQQQLLSSISSRTIPASLLLLHVMHT